MFFHIVTIFPGIIENYVHSGILGKAMDKGLLDVKVYNLREFAVDRFGHIDESVFGQGRGMLYRPEPLDGMIQKIKADYPDSKVVYLTPQGKGLNNKIARSMAREKSIILLSARYEGIDARIVNNRVDLELSIGDYVLTGGELPALVFFDAVSRFVEGSIKSESANEDSFENGLLEYDHYTEPLDFKGNKVPEILRSGNHQEIEKFRLFLSLKKTYNNRLDMVRDYIPFCSTGTTENTLRIIHKKNRFLSEHLESVQKITEEWKNGRRKKEKE